MRILLADDSVTAQNMGKKILSEAGHEVVCVSNGAAALKKISEQEPELVILDIYMPGYSGLEVCQKLKETSSTADVPVVLTVGKLEPFRKEDAQRVRAEALIIKPFEASELAAAVARFAEIASAKPAKAKSRGKLGPQSKAKPQWDEASEEEFVTTTRKLEEQEPATAAKRPGDIPAEKVEAAVEPQSMQGGSEFEVKPEAQASEPAVAAPKAGEPSFGENAPVHASSEERETGWPEAAPAEFSVQAEKVGREAEQPHTKAAAAGAGSQFGGGENHAEMTGGMSPAADFTVAPPLQPAAEPAKFDPPTSDGISFASISDAPVSAAPELSAATMEPSAPGVDPAFDPDRTQWVTQFPTHFGVKEAAAEEGEAPANQQAGAESGSATPEEIAAILSNLPGAGYASSPERAPETEEKQEEPRPWPVEASEMSAWKAEEVPLEDQDSSISLVEEMDKASRESQPGVPAEAPALTMPTELSSASTPVEPAMAESEQSPATMQAALPGRTSAGSFSGMQPVQPEPQAEEPARENEAAGPDRVAGVMHSAAMAIATRATVSAVASQLHGQPQSESAAMGPSVIEELVDQVLERLKPKLVAEIKRELKATEET